MCRTDKMARYLSHGTAGEVRILKGAASDLSAAPISWGSAAIDFIGAAPLLQGGENSHCSKLHVTPH